MLIGFVKLEKNQREMIPEDNVRLVSLDCRLRLLHYFFWVIIF